MDRIKKFVKHGRPDYVTDQDGKRKFRKESNDEGVFRTAISADWLNDVQEEIISVIEEAEKKPEIGKLQLLDSIQALIGAETATAKASATQSANEYSNSQNNKLANDLNGKISAAKASATQSANEYSNSQNNKLANDLNRENFNCKGKCNTVR